MTMAGSFGVLSTGSAQDITCRARNSTNDTLTTSTDTIIELGNELFDTGTMHDPCTDNSRITVTVAGKYIIHISVSWNGDNTGIRRANILLNGTTIIASSVFNGFPGVQTHNVSTLWDASINDYFEIQCYQDSGCDLDVDATASLSPELGVIFIGV